MKSLKLSVRDSYRLRVLCQLQNQPRNSLVFIVLESETETQPLSQYFYDIIQKMSPFRPHKGDKKRREFL